MAHACASLRTCALAAVVVLSGPAACTLESRGEAGELPSQDGSVDTTSQSGAGGTSHAGAAGNPSSGGTTDSMGGAAGNGPAGAAGAAVEDCTNSLDDDGDEQTDCADPECQQFQCAEAIPATWEGFFRMQLAPHDEASPVQDCGWGATAARYFAEPDNEAQCEPCTCSQPSGFACAPPHILCAPGHDDCSGASAPAWDAAPECKTIPTSFSSNHEISCKLSGTADMVKHGSCDPSVSKFSNLPLWLTMADLCPHPFGAGCASGVCVHKPIAPYAGELCILKDGIRECPSSWPARRVLYSGGSDSRSCSLCTCAVSSAKCEGGSYTFYDSNGCAACSGTNCHGPVNVGPGPECVELTDVADGNDFSALTKPAHPIVTCEPSPVKPQGMVVPVGERTICCKEPPL